ncbi:MCP four helix bundle domain-containing protein, partial [Egicoccus sp. AB-alg6-2]|uniref:MCP four helix bundle domain-containing protein n=1 Tax=Egicoccus sp. AB-alg6-2 TaxID=3242692 RepID=UPI00359ED7EB
MSLHRKAIAVLSAMSLQRKLIAGFGLVIVLFVLLSAFTITRMAAVNSALTEMAEEYRLLDDVTDIDHDTMSMTRLGMRIALTQDRDLAANALVQERELSDEVQATIDHLAASVHPADQPKVVALDEAFTTAKAAIDTTLELVAAGEFDAATTNVVERQAPAVTNMVEATDVLLDHFRATSAAAEAKANATYAAARALIITVVLVVAALATGLAIFLGRSISGTVGRSSRRLGRSSDDLAAVSAQVSAASEETATQANVVAAAGEQVSHNVQTVATAVEEMSASVREIATSSADASKVAADAVRSAELSNV